eukprot:gb/GEZN01001898.1/.p1 GENE.gb/GEZN01001898.1/~~gb/GEZN01001898.1/.p1  ORF type:complete len:840 (-),score=210.92 gb/GEZN01001898.1/:208-2727(-)
MSETEDEKGRATITTFFPSQKEALIRQAHMLTKENQLADALEVLTTVLKAEPTDQEALTIRALVYWKQKDNEKALVDANLLVEKYPKYGMGHHRLGQVLFTMGDLDKAITSLKKASSLDPDNRETDKTLEAVKRMKKSGLTDDSDALVGVLYMKKVMKGAGTKAAAMDRWVPRHCKLSSDIFSWFKAPKDKRPMGVLPVFTILHVAQLKIRDSRAARMSKIVSGTLTRSSNGGSSGDLSKDLSREGSTDSLDSSSKGSKGSDEDRPLDDSGSGTKLAAEKLDATFDLVVKSDQTYTFHFKAENVEKATEWVQAFIDRIEEQAKAGGAKPASLKLVGNFWQDAQTVQLQVLQKKLKETKPIRQGNVQKRNPRNNIKKGWEPRRVCLYSEFLVYYKPDAQDDDPAGMISIPSMNSWEKVKESPTELRIVYGGVAKYEIILKEDTEEACSAWLEELEKAKLVLTGKQAQQEAKKNSSSVLPRLSIMGGRSNMLKNQIKSALKGGKEPPPPPEDDYMIDEDDVEPLEGRKGRGKSFGLLRLSRAKKAPLKAQAQVMIDAALAFPEPDLPAAPTPEDLEISERSRAISMAEPLTAVLDKDRTCPMIGGYHFVDVEGYCVNCGSSISEAEKAIAIQREASIIKEEEEQAKVQEKSPSKTKARPKKVNTLRSSPANYRRPRKSLIQKNKALLPVEEEKKGPTPEQIAEIQRKAILEKAPEDNLYSSKHKDVVDVGAEEAKLKKAKEDIVKRLPKGFRRTEGKPHEVAAQVKAFEKKAKAAKIAEIKAGGGKQEKKQAAVKLNFVPPPWVSKLPEAVFETTKEWMPPAPEGSLFSDPPPEKKEEATT